MGQSGLGVTPLGALTRWRVRFCPLWDGVGRESGDYRISVLALLNRTRGAELELMRSNGAGALGGKGTGGAGLCVALDGSLPSQSEVEQLVRRSFGPAEQV